MLINLDISHLKNLKIKKVFIPFNSSNEKVLK